MKKVLIVSNSAGLITSFLKNDVEIYIDKGYKIVCACNMQYTDTNTGDFFRQNNIDVIDVNFPIRKLEISKIINSYRKIKMILKKDSYSVIHCHSTIAAIIARACAKKDRKKEGLKVCYTSHGLPFYNGNFGLKAKMYFSLEKYYSKYTDLIFSICKEDYSNLKKMHCKNVYLMHGVGVDVNFFHSCAIERNEYRRKIGVKDTDIMILSVGELNTNKNHQVVIEALSKLDELNFIYVICGRELTEKGKRDELISLAEKLNVRLLMLGFRKDIAEICKCADIGTLPSYKEGLGLAGVEMLASGLPVVGSNRQGIKDYVVDGITGYRAEPNSADSFAAAINKCLELRKIGNIQEQCVSMSELFTNEKSRKVLLKGMNSIDI